MNTPTGGSEIPDLVEGFESFVEIGRGGFSTVYGAIETRLRRPVAIKVLHTQMDTVEQRETFERECRVMGLLSRHPHIVTVYSDAETLDGAPCLVMERYDGNYRERISSEGRLPLPELLDVGVKIAGALQSVHDTGVLHRDIKPHNLFLSDFGEPALGDFGISSIDDERSSTIATAFSVAYCSPEALEDEPSTYLSDVYSLAAAVFHMATGRAPFAAPQIADVIRQILDPDHLPMFDRPDAPTSLGRLLAGGLAMDPLERPDSAGSLGAALQEIQAELGLMPTRMALRREERYEVTGETPPSRSPRSSRSRRSASAAEPSVDDPEVTSLPDGAERSSAADAGPVDVPAAVRPHERAPLRSDRASSPAPVAEQKPENSPSGPDSVDARRGSIRDHVAVDIAIGVAVVALVIFALVRLL